jgi:hypothetical protein
MKKSFVIYLNLILLLATLVSCQKEATTTMKGYIYDASGAPISQAKVTVTHENYDCWKCMMFCNGVTECGMLKGKQSLATTDKNGYYEVEFLDKDLELTKKNYFTVLAEKDLYASNRDTVDASGLNAAKTLKLKPQAQVRITFIDNPSVNIGDFDGIRWAINKNEISNVYTVKNSPKVQNVNFDLNKSIELDWFSYKIDGYNGGVRAFTGKNQTLKLTEQKSYDVLIEY